MSLPEQPDDFDAALSEWMRDPEFAAAYRAARQQERPTVDIPLPWTKPPLTGNRTRGNPYARGQEVATAKVAARLAIARYDPFPMVGANVTLHLRMPDHRRRDADGLAPTLKVVLDALVAENVLPDDSWAYVPSATCRIHPPNGEPASMWVTLEELS